MRLGTNLMTEEERARGGELATALKGLHRALIRAEAGDDPELQNPYTLLFAVIGDPRFSWMGALSQLIVQLEEALDDKEDIAELAPFLTAAGQLLGEEEGTQAEFRLRYLMALQKEPDVALATGALRRVLTRLAQPR
ncbi:hypothetical protein [Mesorhizobium sp. L-8-10]|uniref:hypothetical protein n=1 Tax=Mesorhizobium sp. L-8-10 TaxID=2744523 RepID=UPI00192776B6|nr:hypothetical protein [Mesorhizobium sp. L-8-10]